MSNTINIGIDLGTTNSVIARYSEGEVRVFKDPSSWKETLPSVVAFRKDFVLVGNKAKERLEKDAGNVFGSFKRKMGTAEQFHIKASGKTTDPIELSAHVLRELRRFLPEGEHPDAAVITIPASFDTMQSNATKEAGKQAGFKEVVLLQEPIAASLAFLNNSEKAIEAGTWLVYDLGGGTFDVAIVTVKEGEMTVVDHEGDNFLGGGDFDSMIAEQILIPAIQAAGTFHDDLATSMKSASGRHNAAYILCLHKAEQAKIALSNRERTDMEILLTDDEGEEIEVFIEITRQQLEQIIQPHIDQTIALIKDMLSRNNLKTSQLQFVLMVGGSTFIPAVQRAITDTLKVPVNNDIDPTTVVGIGAAYYAGTKTKRMVSTSDAADQTTPMSDIKVILAHPKATNDTQEYVVGRFEGNFAGYFYKIMRLDGGYDSGLKPIKTEIQELLTIAPQVFNMFKLSVFDANGNNIGIEGGQIGIAHGKYSVVGQPLPFDICLEIDDLESSATLLEIVFQKNELLPMRKTIVKTLNKTIAKNSEDYLRINILEGAHLSTPEANQSIGYMQISGKQLTADAFKGSDVELTISVSESRDITVGAYIVITDQEFNQVFEPSYRNTAPNLLEQQFTILINKLNAALQSAEKTEDYTRAAQFLKWQKEAEELRKRCQAMSDDDVTDQRYQIEDAKRRIARGLGELGGDNKLNDAKLAYINAKNDCKDTVEHQGNDIEKERFQATIADERNWISGNDLRLIKYKTEQLQELRGNINWRQPSYQMLLFNWLRNRTEEMNNQERAEEFVQSGQRAISNQDWHSLSNINNMLWNLLPHEVTGSNKGRPIVGF